KAAVNSGLCDSATLIGESASHPISRISPQRARARRRTVTQSGEYPSRARNAPHADTDRGRADWPGSDELRARILGAAAPGRGLAGGRREPTRRTSDVRSDVQSPTLGQRNLDIGMAR